MKQIYTLCIFLLKTKTTKNVVKKVYSGNIYYQTLEFEKKRNKIIIITIIF